VSRNPGVAYIGLQKENFDDNLLDGLGDYWLGIRE